MMDWLLSLISSDYRLMKKLREIDQERVVIYRDGYEQLRKDYNEMHDFMMTTLIKVIDKENKGGTE